MTIATFNANSVRARLDLILDYLAEHRPDVLAIQEIKVEDAKFPQEDFNAAGYNVIFHGIKSYNGVAIASLDPPKNVQLGFGDPEFQTDARAISAEINGIRILNTYVPNGNTVGSEKFAYKLKWLERMATHCETLPRDQRQLWLGDINIAPTPNDVYDSPRKLGDVGHHPDEFAALDKILAWGWVDVFRQFHQGPGHYTFWDFLIPNGVDRNLGWRIDHIYADPELAKACVSCEIDRAPRLREKPSDHTVVTATFDI
ncbi:MAG: exodeoxyribonuclease III [Fimbriimonadaceae bacterium]|nr:exodeoxyribonuclease III [Fimbriimonadaceae bacterium]